MSTDPKENMQWTKNLAESAASAGIGMSKGGNPEQMISAATTAALAYTQTWSFAYSISAPLKSVIYTLFLSPVLLSAGGEGAAKYLAIITVAITSFVCSLLLNPSTFDPTLVYATLKADEIPNNLKKATAKSALFDLTITFFILAIVSFALQEFLAFKTSLIIAIVCVASLLSMRNIPKTNAFLEETSPLGFSAIGIDNKDNNSEFVSSDREAKQFTELCLMIINMFIHFTILPIIGIVLAAGGLNALI